ncbi:Mg2+ and Co2+ transporter, putative, partial [Ixodes scapularis]
HDANWKGLCKKYWLETELPPGATWRSHFRALHGDLRRYVHCYAQMKAAWEKIGRFMSQYCPVIAQSIKAGTTEEKLDEAERKLGVRFPDDLRCCYRIHNGQRLASPGLMGSMSIPSHYRSESLLDIETAIAGFQSREGLQGCMPLTFCLHSGLTQFIALKDTDGHLPQSVFYPSQDLTQGRRAHPIDAFITARSFLEWFTTYADMLENNEFVVLDNQPYRFFHEPGCELTTDNITVSVATCFVPELSSINPPHFFHTYRITAAALRVPIEACDFSFHFGTSTSSRSRECPPNGLPVLSTQIYPVMCPGAYFSWVSCTSLSTTYGNMKGHFIMRNLETGDLSEVHCPVFHMKCLPYVTSVEREALKREREALKKAQ